MQMSKPIYLRSDQCELLIAALGVVKIRLQPKESVVLNEAARMAATFTGDRIDEVIAIIASKKP